MMGGSNEKLIHWIILLLLFIIMILVSVAVHKLRKISEGVKCTEISA